MEKVKLEEELKKELGKITDNQIIPVLKSHEETLVMRSVKFPNMEWNVEFMKFRDIYIISSFLPDLTHEKVHQITITKSKDAADLIFIKEVNVMEILKGV